MTTSPFSLAVHATQDVTVTPVGLVIKGDIAFGDWASIGPLLGKYNRGIAWAIGDWLNTGEYRFGETYAQAIDTTGLSLGRLRNLKSLAHRVPYKNRTAALSLSHHEAVAPFPEDIQLKLLNLAVENGLDRDQMRELAAEMMAEAFGIEDLPVPQLPKPIPAELLLELSSRMVREWEFIKDSMGPVGMSFQQAMVELKKLLRSIENAADSDTNE